MTVSGLSTTSKSTYMVALRTWPFISQEAFYLLFEAHLTYSQTEVSSRYVATGEGAKDGPVQALDSNIHHQMPHHLHGHLSGNLGDGSIHLLLKDVSQ
jgi:hypothetical protein